MSVLKRLFHWGPLVSMLITVAITYAMMSIQTGPMWRYIFLITNCLALHSMWCATFIRPDDMIKPLDEKASGEGSLDHSYSRKKLPNKSANNKFCRQCKQVVLDRHHHCYMINNCVGKHNEQYFIRFLTFALVATLQSAVFLTIDIIASESIVIINLSSIGLSIGVLIAVTVLLYTH